jgi:predicted enzyme related to lactoylglutathione lyase
MPDAAAARASELGGAAVFREPFDVLDAGRVAAIRDPTGAIVSLWQPRARIGATIVNDVGALCWNKLATIDVERAKSFFGELLAWEYETAEGGYVFIRNAAALKEGCASRPSGSGACRRTGFLISRSRTRRKPPTWPSGWVDAGSCRVPTPMSDASP